MKDLKGKYKPFNYSSSRSHVVEIIIAQSGATKIEVKLPNYMKRIIAIYYTMALPTEDKVLGLINLSFNDGSDKILKHTVFNTLRLKHNTMPIPINITLLENTTMQGYFLTGQMIKGSAYSLKIYLHYTK